MKERSFYKSQARNAMEGVWTILALAFLIQMAIIFFVSVFASFIPVVGTIVSALIAGPFTYAISKMSLDILMGNSVRIENVFDGFKDLGRTIELVFRQYIIIFLWSLLFIIPGIVAALSYSMVFYILADHPEYTPKQAMDKSKEMMEGHRFELFKLQLSFIGWNLLSVLTFGVLMFWVMPYTQLTTTAFYNDLKALKFGEERVNDNNNYGYPDNGNYYAHQAPTATEYPSSEYNNGFEVPAQDQ